MPPEKTDGYAVVDTSKKNDHAHSGTETAKPLIYFSVAAGALLPLLERWQLPAQEVHAVFPSPKMLPSKVKSLCDFLAPRFVGDWWAV